jgi:outer membrane protein OmpA-like peptidoglycan-associated protein
MRRLCPALVLFLAFHATHAQQYLGVRNGNYAGILGSTLNPSFMADSKLSWDLNLGAGSLTVDNTFLYIPKDSLKFFGIGRIVDLIENHSTADPRILTRFDINDPNAKQNGIVAAEGLGPSFYFSFAHRKHALGVTTGSRFYTVINNVPSHQAQQAYYENRYTPLYGQYWSDDDITANALGWFEYGIQYAGVFYEKGKHQLKGGIGIKYLDAVGGTYVKNVQGEYNLANADTLYIRNASVDYGHINYESLDYIENYKDLIHGHGWGGSIGFTYEFLRDSADWTYEMDCKTHIDPNKSPYLLKLGLSVTDIGSVKLDENANNYRLATDQTFWEDYRAEQFDSHLDFDQSLSQIFYGDSTASFVNTDFKMGLPTSLNFTADWNFYKNFYLNATVIQSFGHSSGQGVKRPSVYSLTPRYEYKWFEVSVPLSLLSYQELKTRLGLCVRAGYFFIGGDALGGLMAIRDLEGADVYAGLHFFIPDKKLKDSDGDGVSDKLDQCPTEKGTCATHGCPDRDGDTVLDKDDECPDDPGPVALKGCPDRDGDGLIDKRDSCPDDPGPIELNGCPDRDGDGVIDKLDECPDDPGPKEFNGCPDRDGDGLIDKLDECPDDPGPKELNGCPDRDGDGVIDKVDQCPDVPGPKENNGCPFPPAELERLSMSSQFILFKTGSAIIEPRLFQTLDVLAELMNKYPNQKWIVEGHTDITGSDRINDPLSERRAESVRDYLVRKGVKAENITTIGYGSKKPIDTNSTAAGRQKNRRAEVKPAQ